jgi:hypothetical protein
VDALGRGHVRYDESTATRLGECADLVRREYAGDLRKLAERAGRDPAAVGRRLREFPGIGPTGVAIFCREAQGVWPFLRPQLDRIALDGARRVGLPDDRDRLSALVEGADLAAFAAALVRVARDPDLAEKITSGRPSGH